MKHIYIAATTRDENGRQYSYIIPVTDSDNLMRKLSGHGLVSAQICQSRKSAESIVKTWNATDRAEGRYMFPGEWVVIRC